MSRKITGNNTIHKFRQWLSEKGYRADDPRFCAVPERIPGIRSIPDPQAVSPIHWDGIKNPYASQEERGFKRIGRVLAYVPSSMGLTP